MKGISLVLSILLLFADGVWGDYWDYDDCGHDQKPCLTKEGSLMEGRYEERIVPRLFGHVEKGMLNGPLYERCGYGVLPDSGILGDDGWFCNSFNPSLLLSLSSFSLAGS